MQSPSDPYLARLRWLTWTVVLLFVLWQFLPLAQHWLIGMTAEPRPVTARGDLAADEQATIAIFERASPSVVFITTRQRVVDLWTRNVFSVPRGTGSGFVWDDLGHIVTNHHVIAGASEALVRLNDGRSYRAVLVGSSPAHDLAVLRIDVKFDRPPPVPIGTSHDLKVGQKVFAIGNPFGLDYTLTSGLVSALDRSLTEENGARIEHLIQTDAAINPGNSGGPLLDSAGRLIGINTAIYSPSGAYAGIGFAVPVDTVNRVVPELIARGRYIRPSLGIRSDQRLSRLVTEQLEVPGVLVLEVTPGSPAEQAGLRGTHIGPNGELVPGDILIALDDRPLDSIETLQARLGDHRLGDRVRLRLWRNGEVREVEVVLDQDGS
ncbi:S1C family serine protease [endosymbiont of unidentified scaly snail isolate Monju]|uniref:S1C family serine protease n=1 Tax=endosymbiont of unidentified scaly snail isolate Monju TaxID=1248727 RepID=UPI000389216A|nr:trypsin-like peptidase domain-containing protein [endosymbiont of unidentified scaly snail isolate Monju]BAN68305.1 putative serine protease PepD [endosymbiont of unidentified scaly snail isolate Monju]